MRNRLLESVEENEHRQDLASPAAAGSARSRAVEAAGPAAAITEAASLMAEEPEEYRDIVFLADGLPLVTVPRDDGERWVRVMRRDGLVTLGLAPLTRDSLMDSAEVVVPPDVRIGDLEIDVVVADGVASGAPAQSGTAAIRSATLAGRDAARLERLGHRGRAAAEWARCGRLWDLAGDEARARLAHTYSACQQRPRRLRARAQVPVADAVALALMSGQAR